MTSASYSASVDDRVEGADEPDKRERVMALCNKLEIPNRARVIYGHKASQMGMIPNIGQVTFFQKLEDCFAAPDIEEELGEASECDLTDAVMVNSLRSALAARALERKHAAYSCTLFQLKTKAEGEATSLKEENAKLKEELREAKEAAARELKTAKDQAA